MKDFLEDVKFEAASGYEVGNSNNVKHYIGRDSDLRRLQRTCDDTKFMFAFKATFRPSKSFLCRALPGYSFYIYSPTKLLILFEMKIRIPHETRCQLDLSVSFAPTVNRDRAGYKR